MKTAAQAAAAYGANGSSATATTNWGSGLIAAVPTIKAKAAAAANTWQANVNTPQALTNFIAGVNNFDPNAFAVKVNGAGKTSFAAGVRAASTGKYLAFSTNWQQAVGTEVSNLDRTNPRGDRSANRARQAAYDAWIDTQGGKFRQ
jgi:hypothetical protein